MLSFLLGGLMTISVLGICKGEKKKKNKLKKKNKQLKRENDKLVETILGDGEKVTNYEPHFKSSCSHFSSGRDLQAEAPFPCDAGKERNW